jgi:hypothetical protein
MGKVHKVLGDEMPSPPSSERWIRIEWSSRWFICRLGYCHFGLEVLVTAYSIEIALSADYYRE